MQIIRQLSVLRDRIKLIRAKGETVALVPTMGALHKGHMALVERAKQEANHVVVSIFVNPKQFGPSEDFERYPRHETEDAALLAEAGVTALWMPPVEQVYPPDFATTVAVARLGDRLCGAARPGHFDGVATVVAKLFNQVRPDVAVFGEKDWQQLAVIRRMASDLDMDLTILGAPIVRDADGLALSSRNAYLQPAERKAATALPKALRAAAEALERGEDAGRVLEKARSSLADAGFGPIDYVELVDAATFDPLSRLDRDARLLAAANMGATRLIDNLPVGVKKPDSG